MVVDLHLLHLFEVCNIMQLLPYLSTHDYDRYKQHYQAE